MTRQMNRFETERDLAAVAVAWLAEHHWDVYQEVSTGYGYPRADIVAIQGPLTWIIEVKRSLGLAVMAQAEEWIGRANYVSVAVPLAKRSKGRDYAERILLARGIGTLECDESGMVRSRAPCLVRRTARSIRSHLMEEQKTMALAGSARGGYATPFSKTCLEASRFVATNPGCTLKELVDGIGHHYGCDSTARACIRKWIGTDKIPGVVLRQEGRRLLLDPVKKKGVEP